LLLKSSPDVIPGTPPALQDRPARGSGPAEQPAGPRPGRGCLACVLAGRLLRLAAPSAPGAPSHSGRHARGERHLPVRDQLDRNARGRAVQSPGFPHPGPGGKHHRMPLSGPDRGLAPSPPGAARAPRLGGQRRPERPPYPSLPTPGREAPRSAPANGRRDRPHGRQRPVRAPLSGHGVETCRLHSPEGAVRPHAGSLRDPASAVHGRSVL
jgi:hypothetical protein